MRKLVLPKMKIDNFCEKTMNYQNSEILILIEQQNICLAQRNKLKKKKKNEIYLNFNLIYLKEQIVSRFSEKKN